MKRSAIIPAFILTIGSAAFAQPQTPPAQPAPAPKPPRVMVAPRAAAAPAIWGGEMSGSYLGVDIEEITSDRVGPLKLKEERGVEITMVDQDAPAAKAGLKEHDVVTDFNGQRVEGREQFTRFIRETPPGRTVTLGIVRDGQPQQIKATLGDRKEVWARENKYKYKYKVIEPRIPQIVVPEIDVDIPAIEMVSSSSSTGIVLDNLTPQLAQYFGVKAGQGVLVKSVEKGSIAEKGGLKAGDVIMKVDSESIESRSDYRQAIRHRNSDTVKVVVIRDKKEQTLTLTLPPPRKESSRRELLPRDFDMQLDNDVDDDLDLEQNIEFDMPAMQHMLHAFSVAAPKINIDGNGISDIVNDSMRDAVRRITIETPAAHQMH